MFKHNTQSLLAKEMDRRDFLKHVGIALVAFTGVASVLSTLAKMDTSPQARSSRGYSMNTYGR